MSVTCLYLPYKKGFEPIVRSGENIALPMGKERFKFFRVTYVEPVQPIIIAVSLSASERNKEYSLDEVKLEKNEFGQWRLWILDFATVKMNYPRAVRKWTTKEEETYAFPLSMAKEQILEFYSWKDEVPILYVDNPLTEAQTVRFAIWGFKYAIEELPEAPETYTLIPLYSLEYIVGTRS